MASDLRTTIAERVARFRKDAGLSQGALAKRIGVRQETISRLENGHSLPSVETLEQIAGELSKSLHDLIRRRDGCPDLNDIVEDFKDQLADLPPEGIHLMGAIIRATIEELSKWRGGTKDRMRPNTGRTPRRKRKPS